MRKIKKRKNKQIKIAIVCSFALLFIIAIGYSAFQTNITLTAKGNAKDKSRIIKSWTNASNEDFHTNYYRENIVSVTFLDSAIVPEGLTSWDVSAAGDRGVMAYVKPSTEEGKFDLFIGAKRGVIANTNSSYLFYNFTGVKKIDFNNNFDTQNATNMSHMFCRCIELTTIDVSSFDTSNVTNMYAMFSGSATYNIDMNIEEIKGLENFDTSKVTNMRSMFNSNRKLKNLNLSSFDTSNVTTMHAMFDSCSTLTVLDISSFDTSNVTEMTHLFYSCTNLKTIYASDKFVTTGVEDVTAMFYDDLNLVGGNGTIYSASHTGKEYARIDGIDDGKGNPLPGYFTLKE